MKNYTLRFAAIATFFTCSCLAQGIDHFSNAKLENGPSVSDLMSTEDLAVVSYHVEERINMNFGSSITTYEVSNFSLVGTNDLGENNSRVVTPKYAKLRAKTAAIALPNSVLPIAFVPSKPSVVIPIKIDRIPPKSVNIDILSTYERVLDKGYKSVDMLRRVANARFFDGDLPTAAKYYIRLFELTTDLEPVIYYRYAQSLISVGQTNKANEMMAIYESKNK